MCDPLARVMLTLQAIRASGFAVKVGRGLWLHSFGVPSLTASLFPLFSSGAAARVPSTVGEILCIQNKPLVPT